MKKTIYSVKDAKVGYGDPYIDMNDATAMRNFEHAIMTAPSVLGTHGTDFDLFQVGFFDTESGLIESLDNGPKFIMAGFVAKNGGSDNGI